MSPDYMSQNKKKRKKIVVKKRKMKTSLRFATKNEIREKINKVTEDINKKPDSL